MNSTQDIRLSLNGSRGARAACLLFHGLTGAPSDLQELASMLHADGLNVMVPGLAGHQQDFEALKEVPLTAWLNQARAAFQTLSAASPGGLPVFVGGLSFGALLALALAGELPAGIAGVILMSPPVRFRSIRREIIFGLYSFLPDSLLNRFGSIPKAARPAGVFAIQPGGYSSHALGAVARLLQLRRLALRAAARISCPMLLLQDPFDHHLSPAGQRTLEARAGRSDLTTLWIPAGQHELTLGQSHLRVCAKVRQFIDRVLAEDITTTGSAHAP